MPSSKTLKTPLVKVSATGNDFIFVDLLEAGEVWKSEGQARSREAWVKIWCDRHQGVGADGVAFLEPHPQYHFAWDFYNSDGSRAEMCGNAARAAGLYRHLRTGEKSVQFLTLSGPVTAEILSPDEIEVAMAPIIEEHWNQWSSGQNAKFSFDFVRAGVPHAVLKVPDISDREGLRALAHEIKREARFQAEGVNVTFVQVRNTNAIDSVTYERGVEDFTLSCGTGAVAAAHSLLRGEEGRSMEVRVPGGQLFVVWKKGRPHLRGPARVVAEIRWLIGG